MARLRPCRAVIGPFTRGLNDELDARLLPPDAAVQAINADVSAGTLQALYGPGSTASIAGIVSPTGGAVDASYKWIFVPSNNTWVGGATRGFGCLDTEASGYVTNISSGGVVGLPRAFIVGSSYPMGITAPASLSAASGGSGGSRVYAITYQTTDGLESNPYPILGSNASTSPTWVRVANCNGAVLTLPGVSADSRVTAVRIWGTDPNNDGGTMGLLASVADATASWTDTAVTASTTTVLNWSAAGYFGAPGAAQFDHSPWVAAAILSNALHGSSITETGTGGGMLFGASSDGYTLMWSAPGYPQYLPTRNQQPMAEPLQAIVTLGAATFALGTNSIWVATGTDDNSVIVNKTPSERGVLLGAGHTAVRTPFGVMFLGREGVCLFDGARAEVITKGILEPRTLQALSDVHARFYDDHYFLFHAAGTHILDLRDFPTVRVTTSDRIAMGAHVNPYNFPNAAPGLHVMYSTERGSTRLWNLAQTVSGSSKLALTWKSPRLTFERPSTPKTINTVRLEGEGAMVLDFYLDGSASSFWTLTLADASAAPGWYRTPPGFRCRDVAVRVTSSGGTAVLRELVLEGTHADAA